MSSLTVFSQRGNNAERKAQIEKLRQEYINDRLFLSEAEKAKLLEVQSEFEAKRKERMKDLESRAHEMKAEIKEQAQEDVEISEEEAAKLLSLRYEREMERLQLEKEYTEALIEAISAKKTLEYKQLEKEFRKELLQMLRDDKDQHKMREELKRKQMMEEREAKPGLDD